MTDDNDILRPYQGWLRKMASVYMDWNSDDWEDLAQEGYIAMWRALKTYDAEKGALPAWLTYKASLRMRQCAANLNWTGSPNRRQGRNKYQAIKAVPLSHESITLHEDNEGLNILIMQELPDSVEMAYHHGQISEAVDGLSIPVRRALFKRFWLDQEVHKSAWRAGMPELQDKLAHLKSVNYGE